MKIAKHLLLSLTLLGAAALAGCAAYNTDPLSSEREPTDAAGSTYTEVGATDSIPEGVTFRVEAVEEGRMAYTICTPTKAPLFYEYHKFVEIQKEENGEWITYPMKELAATMDYRIEQIPTEQTTNIIEIDSLYQQELTPGHYRLYALVYPTEEDLMKATEDAEIELIREFLFQ